MDTASTFRITFALYSIAVLYIGWKSWQKRDASASDSQLFWSAGKTLSSWSVGLSISAGMMSISWSCVYGVQLFYWYGPGAAWLLVIPWLLTMVLFFIFTPRFRKARIFSQPQLLEERFGKKARLFLAPVLFVVFLIWAGAEIYAAGQLLAPFMELPVYAVYIIISVIVAAYSFSGGFSAVISTDKLQFALVALFICGIAVIALQALPQNSVLFEAALNAPKAVDGTTTSWFSPGWLLIGITFFAYLPGWLVETDLWVRIQAAESDNAARKGVVIACLNSFFFVGLVPMLIGLAALHLYPAIDGEIPARLQDGAFIFGALMQDYAGPLLTIVLGIGLIAAAMSTIDTCAHVASLSLAHDALGSFKPEFFKRDTFSRIAAALTVFLAMSYAFFTDSLWDIFYLSSGILTTTVFLPVIAVFLKSSYALQVKATMAVGFFATILFYFLEKHGFMSWQPQALAETQLGYIVWAFVAALTVFAGAAFWGRWRNL